MKRILLTGFEPFGAQTLNPAQLLAQSLAREMPSLYTKILTVQFSKAFDEVTEALHTQGPFDLIVMLGQAGGRSKICLERFAHNWMENKHEDLKNPAISACPIATDSPAALMTLLPLEEIRDQLNERLKEDLVTVSLSAGSYVCNHLYFQVLQKLEQKSAALFVHVPYLPEQTTEASMPSLEFDTQLKVLRELISLLQDRS